MHVQNDGLLGTNNFNVQANTNLQSLLASSCNLPGELKVSQCANLDTLSVHNNQLTKLDVSSLQNMHWLNCYNNTGITELNVAASTGMTHLDLHNCSTIDLALESNTALKYFDCDNNKIRENVTIHRGTASKGKTIVGSNNLIMENAHIAHDCVFGSGIIMGNSTKLAGEVLVDDNAIISEQGHSSFRHCRSRTRCLCRIEHHRLASSRFQS